MDSMESKKVCAGRNTSSSNRGFILCECTLFLAQLETRCSRNMLLLAAGKSFRCSRTKQARKSRESSRDPGRGKHDGIRVFNATTVHATILHSSAECSVMRSRCWPSQKSLLLRSLFTVDDKPCSLTCGSSRNSQLALHCIASHLRPAFAVDTERHLESPAI